MIAMIPWYAALSFLVYHLANRISGRQAGIVATLLLALSPTFIYHSIFPLTQLPLATLLCAVIVLTLSYSAHPRLSTIAVIGTMIGVAILVRPSSVILLPVVPVLLWRIHSRGAIPFGILIPALILITPWMVHVKRTTGHFVFINYANSRNLFLGNNEWTPFYETWYYGSHLKGDDVPDRFKALDSSIPEHAPHEQDALYRAAALDHIVRRPDLFLLRTVNRVRCYFAFDTYTGTVLIKYARLPKLLGLATIATDALFYVIVMFFALYSSVCFGELGLSSRAIGIVWVISLAYAVPYWFSFSHPTYHFPIIPGLLAVGGGSGWRFFRNPGTEAGLLVSRIRTNKWLAASLAGLVAVQVEWVFHMLSRILGRA